MSTYEWFLLIVVVIVVPLTVAVVVTLWSIDQANKRKRSNRKDAQIGVKRHAALSPEEVEARKAARARKQEESDSSEQTDTRYDGVEADGDATALDDADTVEASPETATGEQPERPTV